MRACLFLLEAALNGKAIFAGISGQGLGGILTGLLTLLGLGVLATRGRP